MQLQLQIKMNPKLFLRDPESSELGRNILSAGIRMINEMGFEEFTFKKLATELHSTEASIYRYFENKHRLLTYLTTWFWTWMEYELVFQTNNVTDSRQKIHTVISLLCFQTEDRYTVEHIDKKLLHLIVIDEGNKSYLTKRVTEDNKSRFFKPYKDFCHRIAELFLEHNNGYPYPHSLASTLVEAAHHQIFFKDHLPSLTDFPGKDNAAQVFDFLSHLLFSTLEHGKNNIIAAPAQ